MERTAGEISGVGAEHLVHDVAEAPLRPSCSMAARAAVQCDATEGGGISCHFAIERDTDWGRDRGQPTCRDVRCDSFPQWQLHADSRKLLMAIAFFVGLDLFSRRDRQWFGAGCLRNRTRVPNAQHFKLRIDQATAVGAERRAETNSIISLE